LLAEQPGGDLSAQRGVGVGGLTDHVQRRLRRQPARLHLGVHELLQPGAGEHLPLEGDLGYVAGDGVDRVQGLGQRRRLLGGGQ
jgi:hypothetical protein